MSAVESVLRFGAIVVLILMSGMFSGLTLGLLGLDTNQLEIVREAGLPSERKAAAIIYPVRKKGNLLLCTLLLGNVAVNALLSILMADLTNGLVGFLTSTAVIVIFGEIIPQAACARHALTIGSKAIPLVKGIILVLYPLAKPISVCLDWALGKEIGTFYSKQEFMKLLTMHMKSNKLNKNEVDIMSGAFALTNKCVGDIMTPLSTAFSLKASDKLDYELMTEIFKSGFSRIPVFSDDEADTSVVGLLFTKDLILVAPSNNTPVITIVNFFNRNRVIQVFEDDTLEELLKVLHDNKAHFAIVQTVDNSDTTRDPFYRMTGLVTLEDVMEEILQREIVDEHDRFVSNVEDKPSGRVDYEYAHLRLLDASRGYNDMSAQEIRAMAAHLLQNVAVFKPPQPGTPPPIPFTAIEEIVKGSRVIDLVPPPKSEEGETVPDELLYVRGQADTVCTIIMAGNLEVVSGEDAIVSTMGPWDVLAPKALVSTPGNYVPDFSARRNSPLCRVLRITQADYAAAVRFAKPAGAAAAAGTSAAAPAAEAMAQPDHLLTRLAEKGIVGSARTLADSRPPATGIGLTARKPRSSSLETPIRPSLMDTKSEPPTISSAARPDHVSVEVADKPEP